MHSKVSWFVNRRRVWSSWRNTISILTKSLRAVSINYTPVNQFPIQNRFMVVLDIILTAANSSVMYLFWIENPSPQFLQFEAKLIFWKCTQLFNWLTDSEIRKIIAYESCPWPQSVSARPPCFHRSFAYILTNIPRKGGRGGSSIVALLQASHRRGSSIVVIFEVWFTRLCGSHL